MALANHHMRRALLRLLHAMLVRTPVLMIPLLQTLLQNVHPSPLPLLLSQHLQSLRLHKLRTPRVLPTLMAPHGVSLLPTEARIMLPLLLNHSHMLTHILRKQLILMRRNLKGMPTLLRKLSHEPSIIL
jgi:hypothetical protein